MANDPSVTRRTAITAAALIVALATGAAVGWLARAGEVRDLRERLTAAESEAADVDQTPDETADATPETATPDAEDAAAASGTTAATTTELGEPPVAAERVPAIVTEVTEVDGVVYLKVDYIQFLTGDEAAAAAVAAGEESPPPNDYFIVNANTRLREFPVQPGISVLTVFNDDGSSDSAGHSLALADWVSRASGATDSYYMHNFYWLTLSNATITTLEQQYLP